MGLVNALSIQSEKEIGTASFVQSELFAKTFREGMQLVEETANYLDGQGRHAAQSLERDHALAYAGASMRLTTQLMQIASWLLVLRAVREGEMNISEAADAKYRVNGEEEPKSYFDEELPTDLVSLIHEANQLFNRISRLDQDLFHGGEREPQEQTDAIGQQRALLSAFGSGNG